MSDEDVPEVMLASSIAGSAEKIVQSLGSAGWHGEVKLDGIRAVVHQPSRSAGRVWIYNRRRTDITHRYPDVVTALAGTFEGMLDGEIVCLGRDGRPDFEAVHRRDAQSSALSIRRWATVRPAVFKPFDVLFDAAVDVRENGYENRHARLVEMGVGAPPSSANLGLMWSFVQEHDLEGLVLKRPGSPYRPGRSSAWVKVKVTKRITAIVTGVIPGMGERSIGSLCLALWDTNIRQMVGIGNVGTGMSQADLLLLNYHLEPGRPPVVVEVEYQEVTKAGSLRMPVYKGIRSDIHPAEATIDTLPTRTALEQ